MKSIWVAFTGLVRKPEYFERAIQNVVKLRDYGSVEGIIFSTWLGEIDRYSGLREFLSEAGVITVETPDPAGIDLTILGLGNVGRQKITLAAAIRLIPNNSYVFKTRPDQLLLTLDSAFALFNYFMENSFIVDDFESISNCPIKYKIWSGRKHTIIPFFIDDRNFFTHVDVAKKMCLLTANVYLGDNQRNNIAEINWFSHLFVDSNFDVSRMLCIDWMRLYEWTSLQEDFGLLECDIFWIIQVNYMKILEKYFIIGFDGFCIDDVIYTDITNLSKFELPAPFQDVEQQRHLISGDERFRGAIRKIAHIDDLKKHEQESVYRYLIDKITAKDFRLIAGTHAITISLPVNRAEKNRSPVWNSAFNLKSSSLTTNFNEKYVDNIDLSIEIAPMADRNTLIDIDVLVHDKNPGFVVIDPSRPLKVGYRWFSAEGPLWLEFPRVTIERYTKPFCRVSFRILTPVWVGECIVEVDLLIEGERWFNRIAKKSIFIS